MRFEAFWQQNVIRLIWVWCLVSVIIRPGWLVFGLGWPAWVLLIYWTAPAVFWNMIAVLNPQPDKAERYLKKSLAARPLIAQPYISLGYQLTRQKRWAEAAPVLEEALSRFSGKFTSQLKLYLALVRRELGDLQAALALLEELQAQGEKSLALYMNLAIVNHRLQRYPEALTAAEKARSSDLTSAQPVLIAGRIHFDTGDYEAACNDYQWAVDHLSWPVETFYWLGRAKLELGQIQAAVEDLRKAVERIEEEPTLSDVPLEEAQSWLAKAEAKLETGLESSGDQAPV
jgi:tetratricopeptide (TPR) repeat protein